MSDFGQKIRTEGSDKKYWVTSDLHFFHKGVGGGLFWLNEGKIFEVYEELFNV